MVDSPRPLTPSKNVWQCKTVQSCFDVEADKVKWPMDFSVSIPAKEIVFLINSETV